MLGTVERYAGPIAQVIIQAFAREHGADKPKAEEVEPGSFELTSEVPLPLHLASGCWLELDADGWRDLMHATGYEVPAKKDAKPPILNVKAETLYSPSRAFGARGDVEAWRVVEVTKAQLDAVHKDARGVRPSACGAYRFRVASGRHLKLEGATPWEYVAIFVTDSKAHDLPTPEGMAA
mgnify:FL=1